MPADQQSFLLETSVLDELTAPVTQAVAERDDAATMLHALAKADLFLLSLDEERTSYSYHGLFRDLLMAELQRRRPDAIPELNRRASIWYEQHALLSEAVAYCLRTEDSQYAMALLDRAIEALIFGCSETSQVVRWIEQLPREVILDHCHLANWYAWALTLVGRLDDAEFVIEQLERDETRSHGDGVGSAASPDCQGHIAAIRARISAYRGDQQATIVQAKLALDLLDPARSGRITAEIRNSLGFAYRALGQSDKAAEAFAEAARLGRLFSHPTAARWARAISWLPASSRDGCERRSRFWKRT